MVPWSALSPKRAAGRVDRRPRTKTVSLKPITVEGYETGKVAVREGSSPARSS